REGEGRSEPVNLGPCINTPDDEYHPTLTAGEHLYFVRAILTPEVVPGDFYRVDLRIPRGSGSWDPRGCP
ncbi:MAG TPA: hypothetical protein VK966_07235, partial [Longimicrobiales bacterium]|nr:hypothetical protein [Longimicrobiales bacterium]